MIKVGFICVHNSCRSQMAEVIAKIYASDVITSYSGGTEVKPQINKDAVEIIKEIYDVDINKTQHSKLISELPELDIVITMGCNVNCPNLPCMHREDWGLDDPTGKSREEFIKIASLIKEMVLNLRERIINNKIF